VSLGVRDSKKMQDKDVIRIARVLIKELKYEYRIVEPTKYITLVKNGNNLNKIKAVYHNMVICELMNKIGVKVPVIIDQFCKREQYFTYIEDNIHKYSDIVFETKAESSYLSVAAAAIIARYVFLCVMYKYEKELDIKLKKGAGDEAAKQFMELKEKIGLEEIAKYAKINFKNIRD
jgi:ribonuclease HIII